MLTFFQNTETRGRSDNYRPSQIVRLLPFQINIDVDTVSTFLQELDGGRSAIALTMGRHDLAGGRYVHYYTGADLTTPLTEGVYSLEIDYGAETLYSEWFRAMDFEVVQNTDDPRRLPLPLVFQDHHFGDDAHIFFPVDTVPKFQHRIRAATTGSAILYILDNLGGEIELSIAVVISVVGDYVRYSCAGGCAYIPIGEIFRLKIQDGVNSYYSQAFMTYGDSWCNMMMSSYRILHPEQAYWFDTTEEGMNTQIELYNRLNTGGYLSTTFGPDGDNRTVCDFVYVLLTTGNITTRTSTKAGDTLRWDCDGTIYTQNNVPTHALGGGDGIVTVSSTDGWAGITHFSIATNNFAGAPPLFNFPNTKVFWILANSFNGACPNYAFPEVTSFAIRDNEFTGTIPNFNFPDAVTFRIDRNGFSGTPPTFDFPVCETFYINSNQFSGTCPLFVLPAVVDFRIQFNQFSGACPNFAYADCETFWIFRNRFSGTCPNFNIPSVVNFSIRENSFSGTCPTFNYANATAFRIYGNSFSGNCPLFVLPAVETFYIHRNNFTGVIPTFIFPAVKYFWVFQNAFSGTCPNFNFPDVEVFSIRDNSFTGTPPTFDFPVCERFFIYNNSFTGVMPLFLLPGVKVCHVYNNAFTGNCPDIAYLAIEELHLGHCSFGSFESFLLNLYTERNNFTFAEPLLYIKGINNAEPLPEGVDPSDPDPDPPANGKEAIWVLENTHDWRIRYKGDGIEFDQGYLIITFDDSHIEQYTNALPILQAKDERATFYITEDFVDNQQTLTGRPCMSWAQVKALYDAGMDMQGHAKTHTDLTTLSEAEVLAELNSLNASFTANGMDIPAVMAYPYGAFNDDVKTWVATLRNSARGVQREYMSVEGLNFADQDKYEIKSIGLDQARHQDDPDYLTNFKMLMDYSKTYKRACVFHVHILAEERTGGEITMTIDDFTEIIDYAQNIGLEIITHKELEDKMI